MLNTVGSFLRSLADRDWPAVWRLITPDERRLYGRLHAVTIRALEHIREIVIQAAGSEEAVRATGITFVDEYPQTVQKEIKFRIEGITHPFTMGLPNGPVTIPLVWNGEQWQIRLSRVTVGAQQ